MKPTKKIALLHDLCGVGKASFTNMMPILSVMGAEVCPIPTVLLSTHTGGYGIPAMFKVDPDYITQCANHYVENRVFFDVVFIGYLGSIEMVEAVKYFISCFPDAKVIMDPIMGDKGVFYENFNQSYCSAIKSLLPYTDILLPNLTECCLMTGIEIQGNWSPQKAKTFCERLDLFHVEDMVITSVPVGKNNKGIAIYHDQKFMFLENERALSDYHGTGDAFDGVFIGSILKDRDILESVKLSHDFVLACIKESNKYDYDEREGLIIENNLSMLV
ncbi:MAG: PfkB family carbohydrate kinase [Lachnospiraceae bacterium]